MKCPIQKIPIILCLRYIRSLHGESGLGVAPLWINHYKKNSNSNKMHMLEKFPKKVKVAIEKEANVPGSYR